jgi:hypothetical protein
VRSLALLLFCSLMSLCAVVVATPAKPPGAMTDQELRDAIRQASAATDTAQKGSMQALKEWLEYRNKRDVFNDPRWDPKVDKSYRDRAWDAGSKSRAAVEEQSALSQEAARRLRDAAGRARGAQGRGGFPPRRPVQLDGPNTPGPKTEPDLGDTLPGAPPSRRGGVPADEFWPFPWKKPPC